jgi:hypothetical protein
VRTSTIPFILLIAFFVISLTFISNLAVAKTWKDTCPNCHQNANGDIIGTRHDPCSNKAEFCYQCKEGKNEKQPPTKTPTPTPTTNIPNFNSNLTPNPNWTSVLGYTSSFNQCSSLCSAYQQNNCDSQLALHYCNAVVSIDLNKNGKISSSEIGSAPSDTRNCETNARCYDVIPSCACGSNPLDIGSCISLLYQAYTKTGLSVQQALQNVVQETTSGCYPPQT